MRPLWQCTEHFMNEKSKWEDNLKITFDILRIRAGVINFANSHSWEKVLVFVSLPEMNALQSEELDKYLHVICHCWDVNWNIFLLL